MRHTCGRGLMGEGLTSEATRPVPLRTRNGLPLNNNRNQNNNRRRGRGNRNQGGSGNQGNRIDSRARGNAPQLLDKYKKLAEDAHRNGDRVQAEYYLQFADHYFRVIADNRTRHDEQRGDQRGARRDERERDDFDSEFESESDDSRRFEVRERDGRDTRERDNRDREGRDRDSRDGNRERARREFRRDEEVDPSAATEGPAFEPEDNPFTRDVREPREARDGREDRPKRRQPRARRDEEAPAAFDAAVLPPSFSANDSDAGDASAAGPGEVEEAPRPRPKRSGGGTLSAVG